MQMKVLGHCMPVVFTGVKWYLGFGGRSGP